MTIFLESKDLDRFRDLVAQRFGLHFENGRKDQLGAVLVEATRRTGSAAALYLHRLEARRLPPEELAALARELTVAETHFFRHADQFRALGELVLPELLRAQPSRRRLSVLSAGCASGEEAYSIALRLREGVDLATWDLRVVGIDINPAGLAKAVQGRFTDWSLRGLSEELRQRYFRPVGKDYLLEDAIRTQVSFAERNLIEEDARFWQAEAFDVIFCRNVLMYFTPEAARAVIARFARSLVPGGFLFVGPAETLRGMSQEFHLRHSHDTFYYQRRRPGEGTVPRSEGEEKTALQASAWTPLLPAADESWVDAICRASERIDCLGRQLSVTHPDEELRGRRTTSKPPLRADPRHWELGAARELVRQERFDDALQLLRAIPGGQENDPDAQLLQAMILTNRGEVARAEQLCRQVLAGDELNAEAHYLLALCREHAGELPSAMEEDQTALYLDPQFAMPHLHLGLMHKRAGDRDAARLAFRQAGILLPREDASRILLFGGGFSREALIQLCLVELRACGGSS